jgi:Spy/CpxP family protein refolding chaperone
LELGYEIEELPCIFVAAILVGVGVHAIANDATRNPSEATHVSRSRVGAPFNMLLDLTDDQKSKIKEIRAEASEQEKQIRQKEMDDITALLTDDQKKELSDMQAKEAAEKKAGSAERRAKNATVKRPTSSATLLMCSQRAARCGFASNSRTSSKFAIPRPHELNTSARLFAGKPSQLRIQSFPARF